MPLEIQAVADKEFLETLKKRTSQINICAVLMKLISLSVFCVESVKRNCINF